MKYQQLRPVPTATQATPYALKWVLIALFILLLGYTTTPSSMDLVQHQATSTRQHETTHNIDNGSSTSPLVKLMKNLFHHLLARRGMPSTSPVNCDHFHISAHWKQCTEVSIEGTIQSHGDIDSSLDRLQTPKAHSRRSESVNDDSIRGLTLSSENAQQRKEESETSHDGFGNDSGNKITSKLWTPKGPGQVGSRANSARDNIISDSSKDYEASYGDIGGKDDGQVVKTGRPFHGGGGWGSSSFDSAGSVGLKNHETFHEDISYDSIDGKTPSKPWTPTKGPGHEDLAGSAHDNIGFDSSEDYNPSRNNIGLNDNDDRDHGRIVKARKPHHHLSSGSNSWPSTPGKHGFNGLKDDEFSYEDNSNDDNNDKDHSRTVKARRLSPHWGSGSSSGSNGNHFGYGGSKDHETSREDINYEDNDCEDHSQKSKAKGLAEFCAEHPNLWRRESIRNNIGYDRCNGPKKCPCNSRNCHSSHFRLPLVEHIPTNKGKDNVVMSDIRELNAARKPVDHESIEVKDQLNARSEIEDDEKEVEVHKLERVAGPPGPIQCLCNPRTPKCHCRRFPPVDRISNEDERKKPAVSDITKLDHEFNGEERRRALSIRSEIESVKKNNEKHGLEKIFHMYRFHPSRCWRYPPRLTLPGGNVQMNKERDISMLSDIKDSEVSPELAEALELVPPKCTCSPKNTKCPPYRDQGPHMTIHESQSRPITSLSNPSGAKAEQIPGLRRPSDRHGKTSEHISEGEIHAKRWTASLDQTSSTHVIPKCCPRGSIADTTTQQCSERWWLPGSNYRPRPTEKVQVKSELAVSNYDSTQGSLLSAIVARRRQPCHKKWWRVSNGCRLIQSDTPELKTVVAPNHFVLRRNISVLDSINNAKCGDKEDKEKVDCEEKNRTGFYVLCSLLAVVGICGLLLIVLVFLTRGRRKRPSPLLLNTRPELKSGMSTPAPSVSEIQYSRVGRQAEAMRRIDEDENDETGSVRRYTTLDGTTDGWTKWIRQKQKRGGMVSFAEPFCFYH
jgi:hypothetical protein